MVKRTLELNCHPSVATVSRALADFDQSTISSLHDLNTSCVIERLQKEKLSRVTIDIDGTVQSTTRYSEGTAVGFNKKKRGLRSYFPLCATIAQTTQVLRFLHRPGNYHDSKGAVEVVETCVALVREALPNAVIEMRMDSAFFGQEMRKTLERLKVEYSVTVPFERLPELKQMIESRQRWRTTRNAKGAKIGYFEVEWKPASWGDQDSGRFIMVKTPTKKQTKGPIQLDLFEPVEHENKYKVIFTNKKTKAKNVVSFHEGRAAQEKVFGEMKSQLNMDYIPCRKRVSNEAYLLCTVFAHNLNRELQMSVGKRTRRCSPQRQSLWIFEEIRTLRYKVLQTAGRLTRPAGKWTLTMRNNPMVEKEFRKLATALGF